MTEINDHINELVRIDEKLKELRAKIKRYMDRKKELSNSIATYMKNNKLDGIKCKKLGLTIKAENGATSKRKAISKQKEDLRKELLSHGLRLNEEEIDKLMTTLRGEQEDKMKLTIKKLVT